MPGKREGKAHEREDNHCGGCGGAAGGRGTQAAPRKLLARRAFESSPACSEAEGGASGPAQLEPPCGAIEPSIFSLGRKGSLMSHTFANVLLHVIFGTEDRRPLIDDAFRPQLFEYMGGIARKEFGKALIHRRDE